MRFDSPERLKANNFLVVTTGALVLGLSLWVTSLILKSVYGRYDWSDILPTKVNIERVFSNDKRKVAILHSQYTEQTAAEGSTWLADNVQAWEQFAKSHELQYEIIDDPALESGLLENYKIIVLPGTRALSDNEILILKRYLDQGGSVFATSGTGSFREDGEWRGWEFLSQVFGIQFVNEINPDEPRKIHTLRGGLPVTAGIPTGYTLKVATWDRPMECEVLESRTTQASFWYNFRSDSGLVHEELERTAGIVYGSYGKGRFVWMGFELNSVLGDKNDYVYFDRLCKQSVDWLAGKPSVVIRDWPAPYTAATITTASLSREYSNAVNLLRVLEAERVRASFLVDPVAAEQHQPLTASLTTRGDVGILSDPQTDYPAAKATLERIIQTNVRGTLTRDAHEQTLRSLFAAGFDYFLTDSISDRSVPQTIIRNNKPIIMLTKTVRDDDDVINRFGLKDSAFQLYTYKEGVERVAFQGGLYILRVHSHLQCKSENIAVVRELVRYMRKQRFWLATARDVSEWWLVRNALEVDAKERSNRRIALVVSNPTSYTIKNACLEVGINKKVTNIEISSDILGTKLPLFKYDQKRQIIEITIPELEGGNSFSYFIDYDNMPI